jgi:hypothetical protein
VLKIIDAMWRPHCVPFCISVSASRSDAVGWADGEARQQRDNEERARLDLREEGSVPKV